MMLGYAQPHKPKSLFRLRHEVGWSLRLIHQSPERSSNILVRAQTLARLLRIWLNCICLVRRQEQDASEEKPNSHPFS
jgi:hypothetical protein